MRIHARTLSIAVLTIATLTAQPALALLEADQRKCITTLQKDLERTDKQVTRQVHACIKDFAKGRVVDADSCIRSDPRGKIQLFKDKTTGDFGLRCAPPKLTSPLPDFGVASPSTINEEASVLGTVLAHDIFGSNLDQVLLTSDQSKAGAKCQQKVWKAVTKCEQKRLKEFSKCTRRGLRGSNPPGTVDSATDLRNLCLGIGGAGQPDPKNKISKKCDDPDRGIQRMIDRVCNGVSLATAFPGCNTNSAFGAAQCMDRKITCRMCVALNRADGLTRDCDRMDDGLANESCACGDGLLNAAEQCDDGNNTSNDGCSFDCRLEID